MNSRCYILVLAMILLAGGGVQAAIEAELVVDGLQRPVDLAWPPDGSGRMFIVLQTGRILIYDGSSVLGTPFLDISSRISCCGERGLLSMAFHPDYANNRFFYVYYTLTTGDIRLERYRTSDNPNVARKNSRRVLLTIPHRETGIHNGGKLAFGSNGYLYISVGDGGSGGDSLNSAQNLETLLGSILRIDVDGGNPYSIPDSNPFVDHPTARKEIWAFGLRNPWRISFDRKTRALFIADVGQGRWEEINRQGPRSSGGRNYGWPILEGKHCFNPSSGCNTAGLGPPIAEYPHTNGRCSVTGGYMYRGISIPRLRGRYVFADFCDGIIRTLRKKNGKWRKGKLLETGFRISTFGEDESGELYFAHLSDTNGAIYRIVLR